MTSSLGPELPGADRGVVERHRGEAVALEEETGPPFVHRGDPGLVEADPRGAELRRAGGRRREGRERKAELAGDGGGGLRRGGVEEERAGRERAGGLREDRHLAPLPGGRDDLPALRALGPEGVCVRGREAPDGCGRGPRAEARRESPLLKAHPHREREAPGRDVVRGDDVLPRDELHLGEALRLQHLAYEPAVRLREGDPRVARCILLHLDAVLDEEGHEGPRRRRVPLRHRDPVGLSRRRGGDRRARLGQHVREDVPAVGGAVLVERVGGDPLVVHDVAQPPRSAPPGVREVHLGPVGDESLPPAAQLRGRDLDRRREPDRGDLGQDARHVLPPGGVLRPAGPRGVECPARDDAALPRLLEAHRHERADQVDLADDERVDVRVERLGVRRDEHPGARRSHLVLVEEDLREPVVVEDSADRLRLGLRQLREVPVVVVPDVGVVEPRHPAPLPARPEVLPVPLDLHTVAVGVDRRDEEEDDLREAPLRLGVLGRREGVGPLHRHLRRRDLARVDAAGHEEDDLPLPDERRRLRLGEPSRVGEPARHVADPRHVREVLRGGDRCEDHLLAERRLPDRGNGHPVGRRIEGAEVRDDLAPVRERPVRPDGDLQEFRRPGHRGAGREGGKEEGEEERADAHGPPVYPRGGPPRPL